MLQFRPIIAKKILDFRINDYMKQTRGSHSSVEPSAKSSINKYFLKKLVT